MSSSNARHSNGFNGPQRVPAGLDPLSSAGGRPHTGNKVGVPITGRKSLFTPAPPEIAPKSRSSQPAGILKPAPAGKTPAAKTRAAKPAKPETDEGLGRLTRLGFTRMAECLLTIPKDYFDYTKPIKAIRPEHLVGAYEGKGVPAYVILRPQGVRLFDANKNRTKWLKSAFRLVIDCVDANRQPIEVSVFGNVWAWKPLIDALEEGGPKSLRGTEFEYLHLHGNLKVWRDIINLASPHLVRPEARGKVMPVYAGKPGQVSGDTLAAGVLRAMPLVEDAEIIMLAQAGLRASEFEAAANSEPLPNVIPEVKVPADLLDSLHLPLTVAEGRAACELARRLSAETVVRKALIAKQRPPVAGSSVIINKTVIETLISKLPFDLTDDQTVAIDEIVEDLRSPYAMNRLLSGDVGTGKSITFMVPAVAVAMTGANVAILVPSQLLVSQIAGELRAMFPILDHEDVVEVTGGAKIAPSARGGRIFVGTTALISASRKSKLQFALVITDEQHKFSVEQKSALTHRATNVLDATATAIPRTLALVTFGGMDVSVLRQCPVVKTITTRAVHTSETSRVEDFVTEVVSRGGQAAIIYPLVDASKADAGAKPQMSVDEALMKAAAGGAGAKEELQSVIMAGEQWERRFPGRVGVLHGKLTAEEKDQVIKAMTDGRLDVLVSSLVIEVGVTLPSLKAIVINHSERFGLAQLHQLRGRVARKGGRGYMFLLTDEPLEPGEEGESESLARLRLLERCTDGFELAEADMDMRGFGDVAEDSSLQTGTARTLFHNAKLTHQVIAKTAKKMGAL